MSSSNGPGRRPGDPGDEDDATGIRALLSSLPSPEGACDDLAARIKQSIRLRPDCPAGDLDAQPRIPPAEAFRPSRAPLTMPALLGLAGGLATVGVVGVMLLGMLGIDRNRADQALPWTTLDHIGVRVTMSDDDYSGAALVSQARELLAQDAAARSTGPAGSSGALSRITAGMPRAQSAPVAPSGEASAPRTDNVSPRVLGYLATIGVRPESLRAVDIGQVNGKSAVILLTQERGALVARAADPSCPQDGTMLAGPVTIRPAS